MYLYYRHVLSSPGPFDLLASPNFICLTLQALTLFIKLTRFNQQGFFLYSSIGDVRSKFKFPFRYRQVLSLHGPFDLLASPLTLQDAAWARWTYLSKNLLDLPLRKPVKGLKRQPVPITDFRRSLRKYVNGPVLANTTYNRFSEEPPKIC